MFCWKSPILWTDVLFSFFSVLPHSFLKDTAEVCLFVKNLSKNDREYEDTVRHFKNFIKVAGVTGVTEVSVTIW